MPQITRTLFRYRLLAKPPFTVKFPSVTYRITVEPVPGGPQWALMANSESGRSRWVLCRAGETRERLDFVIYGGAGFEILRLTGPSAILDQMCRDGHAEVTWPPHERGILR